MIDVELSWYEFVAAVHCGLMRTADCIRNDRTDRVRVKEWMPRLADDIVGAAGEMAYGKARGVYWNASVNAFGEPDFAGDVEVRTRRNHEYDLIVGDGDKRESRTFALVTGMPPRFRVVGTIAGVDVERDEWRANHGGYRPAWFVPQSALRPLE